MYNLIVKTFPATNEAPTNDGQAAPSTKLTPVKNNFKEPGLAVLFLGPNRKGVKNMSTVALSKDSVIRNFEAKLEHEKNTLHFLKKKLAETENLALSGDGSPRPSFVQEVIERKTKIELKTRYVQGLEKALAHAVEDLPRRQAALKRSEDLTTMAIETVRKSPQVGRGAFEASGTAQDLRESASECLAHSNQTLDQLQICRKDNETAQERNALEARNMAEAVLKTAELQLKSARESKHPDPEIIANREKAVECAKAALAELVDPEQ